jgi:hypothetical protein
MKESGVVLDRELVRGSRNLDLIDQARIHQAKKRSCAGVNGASHRSCLM